MLFCKWYHTIFNIPVGITGPLVLDIPVSETWQSPTSWYIVKQSQWHGLTFILVGWGAVYIMTKADINVQTLVLDEFLTVYMYMAYLWKSCQHMVQFTLYRSFQLSCPNII